MVDVMAVVKQQDRLGAGIYRLILDAPAICSAALPGQFVHIRCAGGLDPLLRRPLSIHRVDRERGELWLLYRVVGKGTSLLAQKKPGDCLAIMGPLGRGFTLPAPGADVVLVGGGMGVAPLFFLAEELGRRNCRVTFLAGARCAEQLVVGKIWNGAGGVPGSMFFRDEGKRDMNDGEMTMVAGETGHHCGTGDGFSTPGDAGDIPDRLFTCAMATDDGSCGHHGPVTDLLEKVLAGLGAGMVYACGPRAMLRRTAELLARYGVPGEVSLEERMGCGVGACLSCVCQTAGEEGAPFVYRRVCVEGPVFAVDQLVWD
ncbi:MAG: dihydroorotate dehydrogenase electron transfer subunit [Thermoanaerobacteraceae bacterium]|nr:dihydroorotate dehydrogenase electron transfer subunit [Thermoanaerobacteraceae bacterium]